jgi:hypothetical protein
MSKDNNQIVPPEIARNRQTKLAVYQGTMKELGNELAKPFFYMKVNNEDVNKYPEYTNIIWQNEKETMLYFDSR